MAQGQSSSVQPFKGDRTLPYHDLYIFPYKGQKVDAFWLIAPPYLETAGDLDRTLFSLHRRGMTSEVLRSQPFPEPALKPDRNKYQKTMDLQLAATAGLRELISQRSEYGAALAGRLTDFNNKSGRMSELQTKAQKLSLAFPPYKKTGAPLSSLAGEEKIYKDLSTADSNRDLILSQKSSALDRLLRSSITSRNADEYASAMSKLIALQDLSPDSAQKSAKIIQGYHSNGVLKGFSIDRLTAHLFTAELLNDRSGFDLIGLNKIILAGDRYHNKETIVALLLLVHSSFAMNSDDVRLLANELFERLRRGETSQALIAEVVNLGLFGKSEQEVRDAVARGIQIWNGDAK
jgi:hypothetical protein